MTRSGDSSGRATPGTRKYAAARDSALRSRLAGGRDGAGSGAESGPGATVAGGSSGREAVRARWPELQWRGDGQKRALTCGTLMHVIGVGGGDADDPEAPGVTVAEAVRELRRIAAKYDPERDAVLADKPVRGGDMIHTAAEDVVAVLAGLIDVSGTVAVVDGPSGTIRSPARGSARDSRDDLGTAATGETRLKLTARGRERLTTIVLAADGDKRYEHVDMGDPVLEYNPALDETASVPSEDEHGNPVWESTEERRERERLAKAQSEFRERMLPKKRRSPARPTYRSWMWVVRGQPLTYAYAFTGTPETEVLTAENTRPGEPWDKTAAALSDALWVRPFLDLVLGGGPDGIWTGKPLHQHTLHQDIEDFAAAGRAGFSEDTVRMSSKAWEMYDADTTTSSVYHDVTFLLRREEDRRSKSHARAAALASATVPPELELATAAREHEVGGSSNEWVNARRAEASRRADDRELRAAGATVVKATSDALMEALGESSVLHDTFAPHDWRAMEKSATTAGVSPRVRCTHTKANGHQCAYWGVAGTGRCELHGGRLIDEEETRSLVRAQQVRIFAASGRAVDTILFLLENSPNDAIRLRAAEQLLSRAGLSERTEISFDVRDGDPTRTDPGQVVRERLARLAGYSEDALNKQRALPDVDAEVIDEIEDDDTLNDAV